MADLKRPMDSHFEALTIENRDGVLWIWMEDRETASDGLIQVFRQARLAPEVRTIVLTGSDEKVFCVGKGGATAPQDEAGRNAYWYASMLTARELILSLLDCDKPVIGRINGHAVGKGCSIALCCDITIMAEEAKIGDTHVKVGLSAGDGGSLLWPNLVGWMLAKRYLLTGDLLTGKEAQSVGLVTEAAPRAELDARTHHWTQRLAEGSSPAIVMTKRALNASIRQQAIAHMDLSLWLESMTFLTEDHREGAAALRERRSPVFRGR